MNDIEVSPIRKSRAYCKHFSEIRLRRVLKT